MAFCCIQRKVGGHGLPLSRVRESERAPIKGTKEKLSRWQRRRKIYWSSKCSSVHLWAVVIAWLRVRYGHGLMLWPSVLHLWHAYRVFLITMQYRTYVRCVSTVSFIGSWLWATHRMLPTHCDCVLWLCTAHVMESTGHADVTSFCALLLTLILMTLSQCAAQDGESSCVKYFQQVFQYKIHNCMHVSTWHSLRSW